MALTKKQTKQLRALANSLKPLFYVGKNDLTEAAIKQADETIEKHELIKCAVQETREAMQQADCSDTSGLCSGNCAGCDVEHEQK